MTDAELVSDDDLDRFIADPALISTHEEALEVISALDAEIASIKAQVDAAQIEANVRPLSLDRQSWLKRAAYACAMRQNERHKVMQRDKELRGIKLWLGNPPDPTKKEANIVKQKRLADEVAAKRLAKQIEHDKLQNERELLAQKRREFQASRDREFERAFVNAAREYLSAGDFEAIRALVPTHRGE